MKRHLTAFAAALLACCAPAAASVAGSQTFAAVATQTPPPLAASLRDPAWRAALQATDFEDFTTRRPAPLATTAYLLYDSRYLYVGFRCEQHGVPITAAQTVDHAGVGSDDHVAIDLDTSGNGNRVYRFRVSPKGIRDEYSSENARYAPPWQAVATIAPDGDYSVMMKIPLDDLHTQGSSVQTWRVNFVRFVAAANEEYTWAYESTQTDVGSPQYWPSLSGIRIAAAAARPSAYADVYALAAAGSDRMRFENGIGQFATMASRPLGIDATVPLADTLDFVGTLNPDFSNVEQDQTTIAPQEFARNYREYRPFFAQGAQFINSLPSLSVNGNGDTLLYTPAIGVFNRGLKVEGTIGHSSLGVLNATGAGFDDSALGYAYTRPENTLSASFEDVLANHTGVRDNAMGVALAANNPHSGVVSVAQFARETGTLIDAPDQSASFVLAEALQSARLRAGVVYRDVGPEFAPLDGYTQIDDIRGPQALAIYNGVGRGAAVKSYQVIVVGDRFLDRSGAVHEADAVEQAAVTFNNLLSVSIGGQTSEMRLYGTPYPAYADPREVTFNQQRLSLGYKDGTPEPTALSYSWGPFGSSFVQQFGSPDPAGPAGASTAFRSNTTAPSNAHCPARRPPSQRNGCAVSR